MNKGLLLLLIIYFIQVQSKECGPRVVDTVIAGKNIPNGKSVYFANTDEDKCEELCKAKDECQGYVVQTVLHRCWLKKDLTTLQTPQTKGFRASALCPEPECIKHSDCDGNSKCDKKTFKCVECFKDQDCQIGGDATVCVENACVECRNKNQCIGKGEDKNTCFEGSCGPCDKDTSGAGEHCVDAFISEDGYCRCSECSTGYIVGLNGRNCHECNVMSLGDEKCVETELRNFGDFTNKCVCRNCVDGADLVKGVCRSCHKTQFPNCVRVRYTDVSGDVCQCAKCRRGYVE